MVIHVAPEVWVSITREELDALPNDLELHIDFTHVGQTARTIELELARLLENVKDILGFLAPAYPHPLFYIAWLQPGKYVQGWDLTGRGWYLLITDRNVNAADYFYVRVTLDDISVGAAISGSTPAEYEGDTELASWIEIDWDQVLDIIQFVP